MTRFHPEKMALKEAALRNLACQECGGSIVADAMFCNRCHAPIVRRYCAGCSNLVPENSAFCPFCGTSAKEVLREKMSLATRVVPIAACLLLLIFFFGREQRIAQHATSRTRMAEQNTAGAGSLGFTIPAKQELQEPAASLSANASVVSEEGRRLNVEAHELMKQQKFAEAIPVLVKAIRAFGDNSKDEAYSYALFNLAQSLRLTGRPEKALPILENLTKEHSDNLLFQRELAVTRASVAPKPATVQGG